MFLVSSGALEGRTDAQFYAENLQLSDFIKIKQIAKVKGGKRVPKEESYSEEITDFWYLRVDNIDEFGNIDFNNFKYISKEVFEILENYEFNQNEIAISNAGTIGKIALLTEKPEKRIILTENCAKLVLKNQDVLPKYLQIILFLPIVQQQMKLAYIQTTIPKLALERIANLKIPKIPPLSTQTQIVQLFAQAYESKKAKEAEAKRLLAGIDAYLLEKLGIRNTTSQRSGISENRHFFVKFSQVQGKRFDPFYHQKEFEELEKSLRNGKYDLIKLGKIISFIGSGSTPKAGGEDYSDAQNGVPFIRVTNLKNNTIDFEDALFIKREIHEKMLKRTQLKEGDVLLSMAGTIGLSVVVPKISEANINQAIAKLETKDNVNNFYLSEFLNSILGKKQTEHLSRPAVQTNINLDEIQQVLIPLPPLSLQMEIAEHIQVVRAEAKKLENEAKDEIAKAKKEVERLILEM